MKTLWGFTRALVDRKLMPTAVKVALVVGTVLFVINHGFLDFLHIWFLMLLIFMDNILVSLQSKRIQWGSLILSNKN